MPWVIGVPKGILTAVRLQEHHNQNREICMLAFRLGPTFYLGGTEGYMASGKGEKSWERSFTIGLGQVDNDKEWKSGKGR
jgi:hypothetical protein